MNTRDRIKELYPGDRYKAVRHQLYSRPDFCKVDRTDGEIIDAAGIVPGEDPKEEPPEPLALGVVESPPAKMEVALADQVTALLAKIPPMAVATAEDYAQADKWFASIKGMAKMVEDRRKELKEPVLAEGRRIDDEAKAMQALLTQALTPIEQAMIGYKAKEREDLRKAEEDRQAALAPVKQHEESARATMGQALAEMDQARMAGDPFLAAVLAGRVATAQGELRTAILEARVTAETTDRVCPVTAEGSRVSFPWKWEITNESMVDRAYCSPDPVKINGLVKMLKQQLTDIRNVDPRNYPGLHIFEDIRLGGR